MIMKIIITAHGSGAGIPNVREVPKNRTTTPLARGPTLPIKDGQRLWRHVDGFVDMPGVPGLFAELVVLAVTMRWHSSNDLGAAGGAADGQMIAWHSPDCH